MSKYDTAFLTKVAEALNYGVEEGAFDIDTLANGDSTAEVEVDGVKLSLEFEQYGGEGDGAELWVRCTNLTDSPTDETVGVSGYYSSWDSPSYEEFKVVKPEEQTIYVW